MLALPPSPRNKGYFCLDQLRPTNKLQFQLQMDYKAMGQIYKGLAQTGAWGCFDEFNRIPVAVLSVCSTQYKTVLDAIRARKVCLCGAAAACDQCLCLFVWARCCL